jgi:hypothetical protein
MFDKLRKWVVQTFVKTAPEPVALPKLPHSTIHEYYQAWYEKHPQRSTEVYARLLHAYFSEYNFRNLAEARQALTMLRRACRSKEEITPETVKQFEAKHTFSPKVFFADSSGYRLEKPEDALQVLMESYYLLCVYFTDPLNRDMTTQANRRLTTRLVRDFVILVEGRSES